MKKYAVLLFELIQEFENRFQDFWENNQYFVTSTTPFSVDINMLPASFQMECTELQADIQLKEEFDCVSLLDFYRSYLPRDTYSLLHITPYSCHHYWAEPTFVSSYFQE